MKALGLILGLSLLCLSQAFAAGGKLLLTSGVSSIDGPAGGGLSPWALTGSYATQGEVGGSAYLTGVRTRDYALVGYGAAVSWNDRIEASVAHQDFDARDNLAPLGLPGLHLKQDIFGLKVRLWGDAILDSDTLLPQIAVGVLHRRADPGGLGPTLTGPLGARDSGTEFYASATKLLLSQAVLVNLTLRLSDANQGGLLGFGGSQAQSRRLLPEVSLAWMPNRQVALGAEARIKPDNLNRGALGDGALKEDDWFDLFVAWTPNKHLSLTLAAVDLGRISPGLQPRRQLGGYLSAQLAY